MNSKEIMLKKLNQEYTDEVAITPHWWGLYKFELAGISKDYETEQVALDYIGADLAKIDELFYETFHPDMFHLTEAKSLNKKSDEWIKQEKELLAKVRELDSKNAIDEFVKYISPTKEEIIKNRNFEHVSILSKKYGDKVFIVVNEGNPVCSVFDPYGYLGFIEGMIALCENPDMVGYLMYKLYEGLIPRMEVLAESGAHGFIGSETLCSSDLISPELYRNVVLPAQKYFYQTISKMGLIPMAYITGNVVPIIDDIKKIGLKGLLVEESKKGFILDIGEITKKLNNEITLFGNLDSVYTLLMGKPDKVREETLNQLKAAAGYSFVMSNGCPLAYNTPVENIKMMIKTAREFK